ncbi:MAG: ATP-binding protein [Ilumatobacteraceae bacterium]
MDDAIEFVGARLDGSGAAVVLHDELTLFGDRVQLVQIFSNLLSNAAKYGRAGVSPVIDITASTLDETARGREIWRQYDVDRTSPAVIAVRDNGIGVPEEHREHIFEVFRRLHGHDEFGGGSGAGLTIARRIAERHGGALWIEPNRPHGSTFLLALPRDAVDDLPRNEPVAT